MYMYIELSLDIKCGWLKPMNKQENEASQCISLGENIYKN